MAETIVDGTLFNCSNTKYTSIKANDKGGKSMQILNSNTRMGLRISTPLMLTWGANEYIDPDGNGNGKFEMSLQFPQSEYSNPDCDSFLENMKALEQKIKADAFTYSKDWFGKVYKSPDIVEELFTPMLKYPKIKGTNESDFSKKPTLRIKLAQWQGEWKNEIYDENENILFPNKTDSSITPLDYLKKGAMVACVIQCGGIWFTNGKFTVTWKLLQTIVQKPKGSIAGKCLVKLKPSEKEKLINTQNVTTNNSNDENILSVQVEDSDDEEEVKFDDENNKDVDFNISANDDNDISQTVEKEIEYVKTKK